MSLNCFVYQAYGKPEILEQTAMSIMSLFAHACHDDFQILVYTDNSIYFDKFFFGKAQIKYVTVDQDLIQRWRGPLGFVHRFKIKMIDDAFLRYPKAKLIYLDGDTYFFNDPLTLFEKIDLHHALMHVAENVISEGKDPLSKKLKKFLNGTSFQTAQGQAHICSSITMWNAGVLGLDPHHHVYVDEVLRLTDQAYSKYQKHVMEQLMFSYVLQKNTDVRGTESSIYHYWNQKEEYQIFIRQFLSKFTDLNAALKSFASLKFPAPPAPKVRGFAGHLGKVNKKIADLLGLR